MNHLFPDEVKNDLIGNYSVWANNPQELKPVIKITCQEMGITYLLSCIDPFYGDVAYGIYDGGYSSVQPVKVNIDVLNSYIHPSDGHRRMFERDVNFRAKHTMATYYKAATMCQRIVNDDIMDHMLEQLKHDSQYHYRY